MLIEPASPYGLPTAITTSPTFNVEELTISRGLNSDEGAFTESTAKSTYGSDPKTVATYPSPSINVCQVHRTLGNVVICYDNHSSRKVVDKSRPLHLRVVWTMKNVILHYYSANYDNQVPYFFI